MARESDTNKEVARQLDDHNIRGRDAVSEFTAVVDRIAQSADSPAEAITDLGDLLIEASGAIEPQETLELTTELEREWLDVRDAIKGEIDQKRYLRSIIGKEREPFAAATDQLVRTQTGEMSLPGEQRSALWGIGEALGEAGRNLQQERERTGAGRTI